MYEDDIAQAKSIKFTECEAGSALGNIKYHQTGKSSGENQGLFQLTTAVFMCLLQLRSSPTGSALP